MGLHYNIVIFILLIIGVRKNSPLLIESFPESTAQNENVELLTVLDNKTRQCKVISITVPIEREDYIYTRGVGAHKLHTLAKSWNEARKICIEEEAHLAIINSKAEEAALLDIFKNNARNIRDAVNRDQAYLGIHDLFDEGEWVTVFGNSLYATGYSEWSTTWYGIQPDNLDGHQNCGALIINGAMDDVFCNEKFAFFCELPISHGNNMMVNADSSVNQNITNATIN